MESLAILDRLAHHLEALELQNELVSDQLPGLLAGLALLETAIHHDLRDARAEGAKSARRTGRGVITRSGPPPAGV